MFQPGELVVYGLTGVCRVLEIARPNISMTDAGRDYYILKPLYQDGVIYTPVDQAKTPMRPVMSREEAEALIDQIPEIKVDYPKNLSNTDLSREYSQKLKSQDHLELMKLTMELYVKNQDAKEKKRHLGSVDERYWKQAEQLLHGELATALGIPLEELKGYIAKRVGKE